MRYLYFAILLLGSFVYLSAQHIVKDGIPRDTSFTLHSAFIKEHKKRPFIKKVIASSSSSYIAAFENIKYSTPKKDRNLLLNLYRPKNDKKCPALLMVHGGGWSSGDLSLQIPMAQQIAAKGYVAIPVEYRLSPEALYPAAVYDLKTAVRWVRANADKYGIDTSRIAISGCSAGGQLATLVGTTNSQPIYEEKNEYSGFSSNVHAIINIDGISTFITDSNLQAVNDALQNGKIPASVKWLGGSYDEKREVWIASSSVYQVTKNSAPICFINSSIPRFHDGRDEISQQLQRHNIYTEMHTIPDSPHTFWLFEPWFEQTVEYMINYLDKVFK